MKGRSHKYIFFLIFLILFSGLMPVFNLNYLRFLYNNTGGAVTSVAEEVEEPEKNTLLKQQLVIP